MTTRRSRRASLRSRELLEHRVDRGIPEARVEPKGFAGRVERAGTKAKHGARRVQRIDGVVLSVRRVLRAGVVLTVGFMLLVLIAAWTTSYRRAEREGEQIRRRDRADIEELRRRMDERRRERAKEGERAQMLERRADEVERHIEAGADRFDTIDPETRRKYLPETLP